MKVRLSILDQTPIRRNSNAQEALQESIALARLADKLGYTRYWLSEHHNIATLAGGAPEILISRLAAETRHLRIGSGGIMLPNHSALKVAENFRLLEALYPGRIDLGMGRAPGGDRLTARLLNPSNTFDPKDYIQQITDLRAFLSGSTEPGTLYEKVQAIPHIDTAPGLWMLTSSGESAQLAAHFGMALSFAQFINPVGGPQALRTYQQSFRPSPTLAQPQTSVGIFAFCSEDEEKVARMQAIMDYRLFHLGRRNKDEAPTYEEAAAYTYLPEEEEHLRFNRLRMAVGTPDQVKHALTELAQLFNTDEIIVATFAETREDRLNSYELLADTFSLKVADITHDSMLL